MLNICEMSNELYSNIAYGGGGDGGGGSRRRRSGQMKARNRKSHGTSIKVDTKAAACAVGGAAGAALTNAPHPAAKTVGYGIVAGVTYACTK